MRAVKLKDYTPYKHVGNSWNADKGHKNGSCNREACQAAGAIYFNFSTTKYYCGHCARDLNLANYQDAHRLYGHDLCLVDVDAFNQLKAEIGDGLPTGPLRHTYRYAEFMIMNNNVADPEKIR